MIPIRLSSIKYAAALLISLWVKWCVCHFKNLPCHWDTDMMDWQNQEGPSPGTLSDDCHETWVDSTEVVVLDTACDWHAIVAALLGGGLTKHMAELGAPILRTPCHLKGERGREGQCHTRRIISHSYSDPFYRTRAALTVKGRRAKAFALINMMTKGFWYILSGAQSLCRQSVSFLTDNVYAPEH